MTEITEKQCSTCKKIKPVSEFSRHKRHRDGYATICKECTRLSKNQNYAQRKTIEFDYPEYKTCKACKKTLPSSAFSKNPLYRDGLDPKCNDCAVKEHREKEFDRILLDNYIIPDDKKCIHCGIVKPINFFYSDRHKSDKHRDVCAECLRRENKESRVSSRGSHLKNKYGITEDDYIKMLNEQNGVCAICGKPELMKARNGLPAPLYIDHDHKNNRVRKLLCSKCNSGIGMFHDSPDLLIRAAGYLRKYLDEKEQK